MSELVTMQGRASLSEKQEKLVAGLLAGLDNDVAGEAAGYVDAASVRRAIAGIGVQAALRAGRSAIIKGELGNLALETMRQLLGTGTPAATRFAAAKWTLEHGEDSQDDDNTPIADMTPAQLAAFMARAQAVIDEGGERPVINITPDNGA